MDRLYLDPVIGKHRALGVVYRLSFERQTGWAILRLSKGVEECLHSIADDCLLLRFEGAKDKVELFASPMPFDGKTELLFSGCYSDFGLTYTKVEPLKREDIKPEKQGYYCFLRKKYVYE